MAIDMEKLRAHTEYVLAYEIDGEEVMTIKPSVHDKTEYLRIKKEMARTKSNDESKLVKFIVDLICRTHEANTEEEKKLVNDFVEANSSEIINQTDVGFRLTTKEKQKEIEEKIFEKIIGESTKNL